MNRRRLSAIVLLLMTLISSSCALPRSDTVSPGGTGLIGVRWVLNGLHSAGRTYLVPAGYRAEINFTGDGHVGGMNGPNAFDARYRVSNGTITLSHGGSGAAGTARVDHVWAAMNSIYLPSGAAPRDANDTVKSAYRISSGLLTISTPTWTLTFKNGG